MDDAIRPEIAVPARPFDAGHDEVLSDEEAARVAREQYRRGISPVEPDDLVAPHLQDGEHLLEERARATLREVDEPSRASLDVDGWLYVTNRRLLHVGVAAASIPLLEIDEISVTTRGLLIQLRGPGGVILGLPQPRRVRVLIAAAISATRR